MIRGNPRLLLVAGCLAISGCNLTTESTIGGSYLLAPEGSSCGEGCYSYDMNAQVTVTAVADPGFTFDYWSGSCSGTELECQLVMQGNKSVTAHFVSTALVWGSASWGEASWQ